MLISWLGESINSATRHRMFNEDNNDVTPVPQAAMAREALLVQQDRIVAAATRDMEALIHAVSHELCVPVRHIDGFVAMFRNRAAGGLDAESRQCLDKISAACANMARMVDDLLMYARNTGGELKKSPVVLTPMIREVMDELAPVILDRRIEWHVGDLPVVWADRMLLRRVLFQLLGNAVKFTRGRSNPRIEITAWKQNTDVVICVSDNGTGFDMKFADRLFRIFQRLHVSQEFEGGGAGLAIVARIVGRHGGSIWAEGVRDEGARFFASFPVLGDGMTDD
jgi:light-regulated signal transduction histidine kinase (bacteriophytochrome)